MIYTADMIPDKWANRHSQLFEIAKKCSSPHQFLNDALTTSLYVRVTNLRNAGREIAWACGMTGRVDAPSG
jgi:hypothetical protein